MASPGTDIAFNVARTEGYRAFANKIWNAARFIFMNLDRAEEAGVHIAHSIARHPYLSLNEWPVDDLWIFSRLNKAVEGVNSALSNYRFDEAAALIYQFFWGEFCDWYLEFAKLKLDFGNREKAGEAAGALANVRFVFETSLRLLSPFMPFLTEEIWHALLEERAPYRSIALSNYPMAEPRSESDARVYESAEGFIQLMQRIIVGLRARRKELGVDEKALVKAKVFAVLASNRPLKANKNIIEKLARVEDLEIVDSTGGPYADLAWHSDGPIDLYVEYEKSIDVPAERERLTKDIAKLERNIASAERQLGNDSFLAKAPANIVEGLKKQHEEHRQLLEKARAALSALPPEA
jgi:valyl-tRNA synthetase